MKIAIPTNDGTKVAAHTGRCRGFVVYRVSGREALRLEYRESRHTAPECGGSPEESRPCARPAHHSHESLVGSLADCEALVTRGLGPRLVADLTARGVGVFVCTTEDVEEAARQFAEGRLARAEERGTCCHS